MSYLSILIIVFCGAAACADEELVDRPARQFALSYGAEILDVPKDAKTKIWFPVAQSNALQKVSVDEKDLPAGVSYAKESRHGNRIGYVEMVADGQPIHFQVVYMVERKEARPGNVKVELSDREKQMYLAANKMVPIDGEPVRLIEDLELPDSAVSIGRALYDVVENYMKYDKSKPGYGNGDVLWACSSKTGNCTDFHSLFISLARNQNIPARFEIGFPVPTDVTSGVLGGYHCWAWFFTDQQGWIGVDISEADKNPQMKEYYFGRLTPDRVAFSTGRDIELVPKSESGPLNYFVYPHVEVDGKIWPKEKIRLKIIFRDQN